MEGRRANARLGDLMRTLLRNGPTGLYVHAAGGWTCDPKEAFDFKTMRHAIGFAEDRGFTGMELAFDSDDSDSLRIVSMAALHASLSVRTLTDRAAA
jgi:hypothetical protein